jgi:hypothetical protein
MLRDDVMMDIDITFCLSDELTDWQNSKLPKEYFISKFEAILPLLDWSHNPKINVEHGVGILGCVSQRRHSLKYVDEYDFTIWLDTDIFFKDTTMLFMTGAVEALIERGVSNYIITPQFVRQWDSGWDAIVNENFLDRKLNYHEGCDIFEDTLIDVGPESLVPINTFKFAGGWFTLINNNLLKVIGIPDSLGHYGLEDTFVTTACSMLQEYKHPISPVQYVIKNHLVGEMYVHRCNSHMKHFITPFNRKEYFKSIAHQNFRFELNKFKERVIK